MGKGWRYFFYTLVALAIGSIAWITISYVLTDRLIRATGDEDLAVRQRAAHRVMGRRKPIEFLETQPQTVRNNVIWALEAETEGDAAERNVDWLAEIACDLSGDLPTGEADTDTGRLAFQRLAARPELAQLCTEALLERIGEVTDAVLKKGRFMHRRAVAARLIGLTGAAEGETALIKALRDEYELVRQQAATALARLELPEGSAGQQALTDYLTPLLHILEGEYACYVRLDSEGRVRSNADREPLIYGPFYVRVKTQGEATAEDLARQRDSASFIQEQEQRRIAQSQANLDQSKSGRVVRPVQGGTSLAIEGAGVTLNRRGKTVVDPMHSTEIMDVVEGELLNIIVPMVNEGPGDLVTDFFVAVHAGSPRPRNNLDRPVSGEFEGERARDHRALIAPFEMRHNRALYHADLPDTDFDDRRDTTELTIHFDSVEADRIEALKRLVNVGDPSAIDALGHALDNNNETSYTVARQAVTGLQRILEASHTDPADRERIAQILATDGLHNTDAVVRCAAAEGLYVAGDADSGQALLDVLVRETDPTVRLVAARAIAGLPDGVRRALLPRLASADPAVQLTVPRMLTSPADVPLAKQLLAEGNPVLSREVLRTTGRLLDNETLRAQLTSADSPTRALAVEALRTEPQAASVLLPVLDDPSGDVRAAAAEALGRLLQPGAHAPLDAAQRQAVIAALVRVANAEAGDYVGYEADEEPENLEAAVVTDKRTRAAAVAGLIGIDDREALRAVRSALADNNADVLRAALPAFKVSGAKLGDQRARLNTIMTTTTMPGRVRQLAALSIWYAGMNLKPAADEMPPVDPLATQAELTKKAEEEAKSLEDPPTEREVVDKTLDSLVSLLNDPNEAVKTAGAVTLIGLGDDRGNKVLRDQIRSKNMDIKREAARLMASLPPERIAAIRGLKKDQRDPVKILIEDLYRDGSMFQNFDMIASLEDHPVVQERLTAGLQDPHPVLRAAGIRVLSKARLEQASGLVSTGLADTNELVREHSAKAAEELGLNEAPILARLRQMIGSDQADPSRNVQRSAQQALLALGGS